MHPKPYPEPTPNPNPNPNPPPKPHPNPHPNQVALQQEGPWDPNPNPTPNPNPNQVALQQEGPWERATVDLMTHDVPGRQWWHLAPQVSDQPSPLTRALAPSA